MDLNILVISPEGTNVSWEVKGREEVTVEAFHTSPGVPDESNKVVKWSEWSGSSPLCLLAHF